MYPYDPYYYWDSAYEADLEAFYPTDMQPFQRRPPESPGRRRESPGRRRRESPGRGREGGASRRFYQIFSQMENEIRQRPAFYDYVSGVHIQQRVRIGWHVLRRAVNLMKALPFSSAQHVAGFIEGTIMASIGQAGAIVSATLAARIADFLIRTFAVYASNPALAHVRAEQIVNVIVSLL